MGSAGPVGDGGRDALGDILDGRHDHGQIREASDEPRHRPGRKSAAADGPRRPGWAGQNAQHRSASADDAMSGAETRPIALARGPFDHRMADIARRQPDFREIGRFEREQRQQMIGRPRRRARPMLAHGPDHRRHIVDDRRPRRRAVLAQRIGDAEAEAGAVDRHDGIGRQPLDIRRRLAHPAQQAPRRRHQLDEAHDRQLADRHQAFPARAPPCIFAANAGETRLPPPVNWRKAPASGWHR